MNAVVMTDNDWGLMDPSSQLSEQYMKFLNEVTDGDDKVIVVGRKTFEKVFNNKPMPGKLNLVLSDSVKIAATGTINDKSTLLYMNSKEEIDKFIDLNKSSNIFICGGDSIYDLYLDRCDKVYQMHYSNRAMHYSTFPHLYRNNFEVSWCKNKDRYDDYSIFYVEWEFLGNNHYCLTGSLEEWGSKIEFVSKNGIDWTTIYGLQLETGGYEQRRLSKIFKAGRPRLEPATVKINDYLFRTTYCYTLDTSIVMFDGYGETEERSKAVAEYYKDYYSKL